MPDLPPGVARRHATTKVPIAQLDQTVEEIRTELATGHSLAGLVPIERLLAAEDGTRVADLMNASPPIVTPTTDQQAVAWEMVSEAVRARRSSTRRVSSSDSFHRAECLACCWPSMTRTWRVSADT